MMIHLFMAQGCSLISISKKQCSSVELVNFEEVTIKEKWLAKILHDRNVIGLKGVFKTKFNLDDSINKHKVRFVIKDYFQIFRIDYSNIFTLVARHDTIRLLLTIVALKEWQVFHMDVKSTFLDDFL
ncbi:Copia protein, partial [Mucuna pruriens]